MRIGLLSLAGLFYSIDSLLEKYINLNLLCCLCVRFFFVFICNVLFVVYPHQKHNKVISDFNNIYNLCKFH